MISSIVVVLLTIVLIFAFAQRRTGPDSQQQIRPRRVAEQSASTSASNTGAIVRVRKGSDLQSALDSARCGETLVLDSGATYKPPGDSFVLRKKASCTGTEADYITIQTSDLDGISAPGVRIEPAKHASAMPKLLTTNGQFVIIAEPGAHHYKFIGIEITTAGGPTTYTADLVNLGAYFTGEQRLATNHIVFDRTFVHAAEVTAENLLPNTGVRTSGRGIAAAVAEVWIMNSYIAGFCGKYPEGTSSAGQNIDSYGVYSDSGPGSLHILNNYIEAQFNNIFVGGAGMSTTNTATISNPTPNSVILSSVNNLAVGDLVAFSYSKCAPGSGPHGYEKPWEVGKVISIRGNTVTFSPVQAQNSCVPGPPDNGGVARWKGDHISDVEIRQNTLNKPDVWNAFSNPKAWIEVKELRNGVIDGNELYSGVGTAIALTVRNQNGDSPWCTIENLAITNNRIGGYKWGFSLLMTDNEQPSMMGGNITIRNNLFYKPLPAPNSAANFLQLVGGHEITVQHNTILQPGSPAVADLPSSNFVFRDNIVANYQYGMQCTVPPNSLLACWPGLVMKGNVFIDTRWNKSDGSLADRYPVGNFFVDSAAQVGFIDLAADNYELAPTSKIKGRATDHTDPGCDVAALKAALKGK